MEGNTASISSTPGVVPEKPEIAREVSNLESEISRLLSTLSELSEKLSPVLRPVSPLTENKIESINQTPLGIYLSDQRIKIFRATDIVNSLIVRLEI